MGLDPGGIDGLALSCASRALPSVILVEYPRPGPVSTIFLLVSSGPTHPYKACELRAHPPLEKKIQPGRENAQVLNFYQLQLYFTV